MKNNIHLISSFIGMFLLCCSCSDFLDETPDKSGSAYIYHMDQLYGMTGSPDLYLMDDIAYLDYGGLPGDYMTQQYLLGDGVEYDPRFWFYGLNGSYSSAYEIYCWDKDKLTEESIMSALWTPGWNRIYTFNTVLENLDQVIQTTENIRYQVEGEARFGRAYYHFILLTQYCLWQEEAPGIGYRENTNANEIPERQTVGYTLSRIYEDLELAEEALTKAGRTEFDFARNFRPTVPTVRAFRARIDLYRGKYDSALQNATDALEAHNTLVDFKNDPLYELSPFYEINLLDPTDSYIASTITAQRMTQLTNRGCEAIPEYEELFLPNCILLDYYGTVPISESLYNLFERENDARWIHFYNNYYALYIASGVVHSVQLPGDNKTTPNCIQWEDQQWLKPSSFHAYIRFYSMGSTSLIGMTTAEMLLIQAECLARQGNSDEATNVLKKLRRTRFMNDAAAENIGGSVQEVLDERYREMGAEWRFFDIKRLNGAENAGISIRRSILTDLTDPNSVTELVITPDDPRWALPFCTQEAERMGWAQNEGWE